MYVVQHTKPLYDATQTHENVGPFWVVGESLSGAHASVRRAVEKNTAPLSRFIALKTLHTHQDVKHHKKLQREADILKLLEHPNIVRTLDTGFDQGSFYIAMDYIRCTDLYLFMHAFKKHHAWFPIHLAVHIAAEILKALAYVHALKDPQNKPYNLIHRDISPSNILLGFDGSVVLTDFGISSIKGIHPVSSAYACAGKPGYIAPECFHTESLEHIDARSDLYAVGSVLYELLTGQPAFPGNSPEEQLKNNQKGFFRAPRKIREDLPKGLEAIVQKALHAQPQQRFQQARTMLAALEPYRPRVVGVPLMIASMLKTYKLDMLLKDLQMEKTYLTPHVPSQKQHVALHIHDAHMSQQLQQHLSQQGYHVTTQASQQRMAHVVVVDIENPYFSESIFNASIPHTKTPAVIALHTHITPETLHKASLIGAYDVIQKPFNPTRLTASVENVFYLQGQQLQEQSHTHKKSLHRRLKIALVSKDLSLLKHFSTALNNMDFEIETFTSEKDILKRTHHTSFHGLIYDTFKSEGAFLDLSQRFRALPGMSMVPVICLTDPDNPHSTDVPPHEERSSIQLRSAPPQEWVYSLWHVRSDSSVGRTFTRYPCHITKAHTTLQGQLIPIQLHDISRGGALASMPESPPLNTCIDITFFPFNNSKAIDIQARLIRCLGSSPTHPHPVQQVCLEFRHFMGNSEETLIQYIAQCHEEKTAKG
jgi:serine/threonine protein kinase